jgi:hypothetical protein
MTLKVNNKVLSLPIGFRDITKRVSQRTWKIVSHDMIEHDDGSVEYRPVIFTEGERQAVELILTRVVKFGGLYLTCFADNKPILANDLETVVDACVLSTNALKRDRIWRILAWGPMNFQRYQYCPGFPRFLTVDGATTYNTWHKIDRLTVTDNDFSKWVSSKSDAKVEASHYVKDRLKAEAAEVFMFETYPQIWRVMLRMLFGDQNSPTKSDDWIAEHDVFTRWFACCVHRPLERIRWAPVIRGAHGVGKGTFSHIAKALMGSGSVNVVHDIEGIASKFAGEQALTRLLVVDECWSKSGKAMQQFKPIVSEDYVNVERKGEQMFSTRATHNTIVFSNYHVPFVSAETERRWWVPNYRQYDHELEAPKDVKQAFHAEGNRLIRAALPLGHDGDQRQLNDLLCWLKLVADQTPVKWFGTAPPSEGFVDLVDIATEDMHDELTAWLTSLGSDEAFVLAQVVATSSVPQSVLLKMLSEFGFRDCQMKKEGGRKVWTKSPVGIGPRTLVVYKPS